MVDILYLTWNRAEFARVSLRCLELNTDWDLVRRLVIYDDGSRRDELEQIAAAVPRVDVVGGPIDFRHTNRLGPPGVMLHYLNTDPAEVFVKIDSDIAVPPGWLADLGSVWSDEIELLGMEVGQPHGVLYAPVGTDREFVPARHIGGVGMMRSSAFLQRPPMRPDGRFGFTEWQHTYEPVRGWISPEVNAPCLDRVPVEPYASLSDLYERLGWQRGWWRYPEQASRYWDWIPGEVLV